MGKSTRNEFIQLIPKKIPMIGKERLIEGECSSKFLNQKQWVFMVDQSVPQLHPDYPGKAWQCKVWSVIANQMDFVRRAPFSRCKECSNKMRHLMTAAVMMRIVAYPYGAGKHGETVEELTPNHKSGYQVASTADEMIALFNEIYAINVIRVPELIDKIRATGAPKGGSILKAMFVYDDKSYDTVTGNPQNIYELLSLTFNKKGIVRL